MFVGTYLLGHKWIAIHAQFTDSAGTPTDPTGTPTVRIGRLDPTGGSPTFTEISGSPFNLSKLLTQTGWYGVFVDISAQTVGSFLCRIAGTVAGVSVAGAETFVITDNMVSATQAARLDATVSSRASQATVDTKASQASVDTKSSQASVDAVSTAVTTAASRRRRAVLLPALRGTTLYARVWLMDGGLIDATATTARLTVYNEDGTVKVATVTDSTPDAIGCFIFSLVGHGLLENVSYLARVEVDSPAGNASTVQGFVAV